MTDPIARIDALTKNARSTWFVLLSVLLFVCVTLMGVKHIDFYGVDRATQLPLVNVSVPTPLFFFAAPVLTAAVYGYFHLYMIRLWDALDTAPAMVDGTRLGDAVAPWIVTDAALHIRASWRKDDCATPRAMEGLAMALNIALAWALGLGVLFWIWLESLPARNFPMSGIAALSLVAGIITAYASGRSMWLAMKTCNDGRKDTVLSELPVTLGLIVATPLFVIFTHNRTAEPSDWFALSHLRLSDKPIVERPANWLPHDIARDDFFGLWCRRAVTDCSQPPEAGDLPAYPPEFLAEWTVRRSAQLQALRKPLWSGSWSDPNLAFSPDFRGATMRGTFLAGINLRDAKMQGVSLAWSELEGALLNEAQLHKADLRETQLVNAILSGADLRGADLWFARLDGAYMSRANLTGARLLQASLLDTSLEQAELEDTNFENANLTGANLKNAKMFGSRFIDARMQGVDLSGAFFSSARLNGADLTGARLVGTVMDGSWLRQTNLQGADLRQAWMEWTDLVEAQLQGASLQDTQMTGALLDRSFMTGSPDTFDVPQSTVFSASRNAGGALRDIDLSYTIFSRESDWQNVFLDASVALPDPLPPAFGDLCQLDWVGPQPLSNWEFYAHWRGWLAVNPNGSDNLWPHLASVPEDWRDVEPIYPPADCQWKPPR